MVKKENGEAWEDGMRIWYYDKNNMPELRKGVECKFRYQWHDEGRVKRDYVYDPIRSPVQAIKAMCKECVADDWKEIRQCTDCCPLYPFRFGKNPFDQRTLSEETKMAMTERFKKKREE